MSGILIIGLTALFFAILGVVLSRGKLGTAEEYFLSRNTLGSGTLGLTLFATGMGVWILFGPAEALLTAGFIALLFYALSSTLSLWMFAFLGSKIRETLPAGISLSQFVLKRFGNSMYFLVLAVTFFYMALVMTAELTGIGLAGSIVFGTPLWQTVFLVGIATLAYMAIGGFRASVATDKVQSFIIVPVFALVVVAGMALSGDISAAWELAKVPPLGFSGLEYGVALLIGVLSAEAFNQVWWQRVYSGRDIRAMRKGFIMAGIFVFPVVLFSGMLGVYGIALDPDVAPSAALFGLFNAFPDWLAALALVLAVSLMMSSMDSLLSGMVSIFTVDIKRVKPRISDAAMIRVAQVLTIIFAAGSMLAATQGASVLYLFLVADLVCAGAAFPVFFGMFSKRIGTRVALIASISGIIAGALLFPDPSFTRGSLIASFAVAFFLPVAISLIFGRRT